jgi:DNA-3-methyladenine glycosylase
MAGLWSKPLSAAFYARPAEVVAPALLGSVLVRRWRQFELVSRIVETEAYLPGTDAASHANRGRTVRNAPMFGSAGHAYVYFIYGMYDMLNIVCDAPGVPSAVLIRAAEPLQEIDRMRRWRQVRREHHIANGPGKLCQAMRITRRLNRHRLQDAPLWIVAGDLRAGESVQVSARVGVAYAGADASLPLRFFIADHPHVSPGRHSA